MTSAAPSDEHRPLSAGANALVPQPASRPSSARRPRADRAGAAPAEPAERGAPPAAPEAPARPAPTRGAPATGRSRAATPATSVPAAAPARRARPRPAASSRARAAQAARAPRAPFVILLLVLMGSGLMCLLLLNTALSENAFHAHELQAQAAELAEEEEALELRSDRLSAPGALADRAAALGMGPGGLPDYLSPGASPPPGARAVAGASGDAGGGVVFYVVPAPGVPGADQGTPAQPDQGAAAGQDTTAGQGSATGEGSAAGQGAPVAGQPPAAGSDDPGTTGR